MKVCYRQLLLLVPWSTKLLRSPRGFAAGLEALNKIPGDAVKNYQPYWSLQAHLLHKGHDLPRAKAAYQKAIRLTEDASVREYLVKRLLECTPIFQKPESQL